MASYGNTPKTPSAPQAQNTTPQSALRGKSGLQTTQRSGVEVTLYPLADKGVTQDDTKNVTSSLNEALKFGTLPLDGTTINAPNPAIVSCTTQNSLASGGTFTLTLKSAQHESLIGSLSDDSWVDISFTANGLKWHVMRGLVDEVRLQQTVSGSGAYIKTYTIIGRSFQKAWQDTPFYFNPTQAENANNVEVLKLTNGATTKPNRAIHVALRDILYTITRLYQRNPWTMPASMPNVSAPINGQIATQFSDIFVLDDSLFDVYALPGTMPAQTIMQSMGSGDLWSIAKEFSDPMYCELFTEQMASGNNSDTYDYDGTKGTPIARDANNPNHEPTQMTVFLRDKPFLTVDPILFDGKGKVEDIRHGPYFQLPQFELHRQTIASSDLGISGYERYNAFFAAPPITTENAGFYPLFAAPLWNIADMRHHGIRRLDVTSKYLANTDALNEISSNLPAYQAKKRALIRDWYCQGAQLLNGTLSLGCGAPQLRIGCRLRIPAHTTVDQESNFYIESVTHNWNAMQGTRTQIGVSRGFVGTENDWIAALQAIIKNYQTNYTAGVNDVGPNKTT